MYIHPKKHRVMTASINIVEYLGTAYATNASSFNERSWIIKVALRIIASIRRLYSNDWIFSMVDRQKYWYTETVIVRRWRRVTIPGVTVNFEFKFEASRKISNTDVIS